MGKSRKNPDDLSKGLKVDFVDPSTVGMSDQYPPSLTVYAVFPVEPDNPGLGENAPRTVTTDRIDLEEIYRRLNPKGKQSRPVFGVDFGSEPGMFHLTVNGDAVGSELREADARTVVTFLRCHWDEVQELLR